MATTPKERALVTSPGPNFWNFKCESRPCTEERISLSYPSFYNSESDSVNKSYQWRRPLVVFSLILVFTIQIQDKNSCGMLKQNMTISFIGRSETGPVNWLLR